MDQVSEVDLTEAKDLRATISGLQVANTSGGAAANDGWGNTDAPIVVHFGDSDFQSKYLTVLNDIGQWRAAAGRVESVDLRFNGEAVVNPDRTILAMKKDPPPITAVAPHAIAQLCIAPTQPAMHPVAPPKAARRRRQNPRPRNQRNRAAQKRLRRKQRRQRQRKQTRHRTPAKNSAKHVNAQQ